MNCVRSLKDQRGLSKSNLILAKMFCNLLSSIVAEARDLRRSNYTKSIDGCVFVFLLDQFFFYDRRMFVNIMEDNDMIIIVLTGSLNSGR